MGWTKVWPGPGEASSAFWSSAGAEEEGAVPETASGGSSEGQEESTPSAYDNLSKVSLHPPMMDVTDGHLKMNSSGGHIGTGEDEAELEEVQRTRDSSSWSSCEVLPLDESSDDVGVVSPVRNGGLPSNQEAEKENSDKDDHEDSNEDDDENSDNDHDDHTHHPNSPASGSVRSGSPLSTGSSDVFLPSGSPDLQGAEDHLQPRDTHSLLDELRQRMAQQKSEYQTRIQRWDTFSVFNSVYLYSAKSCCLKAL